MPNHVNFEREDLISSRTLPALAQRPFVQPWSKFWICHWLHVSASAGRPRRSCHACTLCCPARRPPAAGRAAPTQSCSRGWGQERAAACLIWRYHPLLEHPSSRVTAALGAGPNLGACYDTNWVAGSGPNLSAGSRPNFGIGSGPTAEQAPFQISKLGSRIQAEMGKRLRKEVWRGPRTKLGRQLDTTGTLLGHRLHTTCRLNLSIRSRPLLRLQPGRLLFSRLTVVTNLRHCQLRLL